MSEFRVTEDRRVFLDGAEIKRVLGFSIDVESCSDPQVTIRVAVGKISIDGYTDIWSSAPEALN